MQYVWVSDEEHVFFPARVSKRKGTVFGLLREDDTYVEALAEDCTEIADASVVTEQCDDLVHLSEVTQVWGLHPCF